MFRERTMHIDIRYRYIRCVITQGNIKVNKITIHDNPANMMIKSTPIAKYELCSDLVDIIQ